VVQLGWHLEFLELVLQRVIRTLRPIIGVVALTGAVSRAAAEGLDQRGPCSGRSAFGKELQLPPGSAVPIHPG